MSFGTLVYSSTMSMIFLIGLRATPRARGVRKLFLTLHPEISFDGFGDRMGCQEHNPARQVS